MEEINILNTGRKGSNKLYYIYICQNCIHDIISAQKHREKSRKNMREKREKEKNAKREVSKSNYQEAIPI